MDLMKSHCEPNKKEKSPLDSLANRKENSDLMRQGYWGELAI